MTIQDTGADYKELIKDAKSYYESGPSELRSIRNGKALFDLIWCNGLVDEINLWTYWQGAGVDSPDVMIIGQDFGSCNDKANKEYFERFVSGKKEGREDISREYIDKLIIDKKMNKTDNMLLELTEQGLGVKYSAATPGNKNLFMTNLCLGYRSTNKISGGDMNAYLKHDSRYIVRLIDIKKPKAVVCLGKSTYSNLRSAYIDDKETRKSVVPNFWKALDEGVNSELIDRADFSFRIFGVSHTGSMGVMNRKIFCTREGTERLSGKDLMLEDWNRIGEYLRGYRREDGSNGLHI